MKVLPRVHVAGRSDPDILARYLGGMAKMARNMPPSWDGAGISHLLSGPDGEYLGKMLPGRGLYLAQDAASMGLRRLPPYVATRGPIRRLIAALADPDAGDLDAERIAIRAFETIMRVAGGAISTYDGIIAARAGNGKADDITIAKSSQSTSSNQWENLFRGTGFPGTGTYTAIPGGAAPTRSNAGAWSTGLTDPTGGDKKYLLTFGYTAANQINMLMLIDLLVACGSILATVNTAQTINSTALTRYTSGKGVLAALDITTVLAAGAHNVRLNKYTDQDSNANQDTGNVAGVSAAADGRVIPNTIGPYFPLASGDYGVKSVEEFTIDTALASGGFALNLYFPLAFVPGLAGGAYIERDSTLQIDGISELVLTGGGVLGCLTAYVLAGSTSTGILTAFMRTCAG